MADFYSAHELWWHKRFYFHLTFIRYSIFNNKAVRKGKKKRFYTAQSENGFRYISVYDATIISKLKGRQSDKMSEILKCSSGL